MPIIKVPGDYKSPALRRWRIMEVVSRSGARSRHLWGHDIANDAGRASSGIKTFDMEAMTATTHSGRVYTLVGVPGKARSGERAWQDWCTLNGVQSAVDVTSEYFSGAQLFAKHPHDDADEEDA